MSLEWLVRFVYGQDMVSAKEPSVNDEGNCAVFDHHIWQRGRSLVV